MTRFTQGFEVVCMHDIRVRGASDYMAERNKKKNTRARAAQRELLARMCRKKRGIQELKSAAYITYVKGDGKEKE